jgi:hypothetical protein
VHNVAGWLKGNDSEHEFDYNLLIMKRGKDIRDVAGKPVEGNAPREVIVLQFVLAEKSPGAFILRFVTNQELLDQLREQGTLQSFLEDADHLYADFRKQFDNGASKRPN